MKIKPDGFSFFIMMKTIIGIKTFLTNNVEKNDKIYTSKEICGDIENFYNILEIAYKFHLKIQHESYILSDFYLDYHVMKDKLVNVGKDDKYKIYTNVLIDKLEKNCGTVINNKLMKAVVFLDPRVQIILSKEEKTSVMEHFKNIYIKTKQYIPNINNFYGVDEDIQNSNNIINPAEAFLKKFEYLKNKSITKSEIEQQISEFNNKFFLNYN